MAGEVICTDAAFDNFVVYAHPNGSAVEYIQLYGRGNKPRMFISNLNPSPFDDRMDMKMYYWNGSSWILSNSVAVPDVFGHYTLDPAAAHSQNTRWYFLWDARAYGDGKAYIVGPSAHTRTAYSITNTTYPKGKGLDMRIMSNMGVGTTNVAPTYLSATKMTTARNITT